jgi:hypothetical protein
MALHLNLRVEKDFGLLHPSAFTVKEDELTLSAYVSKNWSGKLSERGKSPVPKVIRKMTDEECKVKVLPFFFSFFSSLFFEKI